MRLIQFFIAVYLSFVGVAYADAGVSYVSVVDFSLPENVNPGAVDVYQPDEYVARSSMQIGQLSVNSDGAQSIEDLIELAKLNAARYGADFVKIAGITSRSKITSAPSFNFALPIFRVPMIVGGGKSGDIERSDIPKVVFNVGVYNKATVGISFDQDLLKKRRFVISEFLSYSAAPAAGLKIGDELLEVNGVSMSDKRVRRIMFELAPGAKIKLYAKRGEDRFFAEVEVVAVK